MEVILFVALLNFFPLVIGLRGRLVDLKSESEWKLKVSWILLFFLLPTAYTVVTYIYMYKVFRDAALISSFRNKGVECHKALLSQPYRNG